MLVLLLSTELQFLHQSKNKLFLMKTNDWMEYEHNKNGTSVNFFYFIYICEKILTKISFLLGSTHIIFKKINKLDSKKKVQINVYAIIDIINRNKLVSFHSLEFFFIYIINLFTNCNWKRPIILIEFFNYDTKLKVSVFDY